jgi:glycerol-3-phosphate dehydrogenase (NAD(P)+)
MMFDKIAVIGAGAFGSALACTMAKLGKKVKIWAHEGATAEEINTLHTNQIFLPNIKLPTSIEASNSLEIVSDADLILLVTPSAHTVKTAQSFAPFFKDTTPILICTKGMDSSGEFLSEGLQKILPNAKIGALSGPMFAAELAQEVPTAATVAFKDEKLGKEVIEAISGSFFRLYYSNDTIGVQIGGMVKNVIAIASGIVEGAGIGRNAQAALITRGLAEIVRFAKANGANPLTLMGLSGLGDLILTANSSKSRNFSLGEALGKGKSLAEIMSESRVVFEGAAAVDLVAKRARSMSIDMPLCFVVDDILKGNAKLSEIITKLLSRPLKSENFD